MQLDLEATNAALSRKNTLDVLSWCYETFDRGGIKLSTSFGAEGMVLLHMLVHLVGKPRVFTVDTGRNFQQTYDVWQRVTERYGIDIESWHPDPADINELTRTQGPNMFYASVADRKRCCYVRKVKPLKRALEHADVWITGLRRGQSSSRAGVNLLGYVEEYGVYKVCPLVAWGEVNVWEYIRNNDVPYNALYDEGYPTIGCAPCCRAVGRAQDIRSGRWWWEQDRQSRECGIHTSGGRVERPEGNVSFNI